MAKTEIEERIKDLENRIFFLKMADHWTTEDFEYSRKWNKEIRELKEELKKA